MPADPPNIIIITTDQQRFDTISELGFDYMETPNLDRLVREGVTFTNCHITAPSCAPSRASLFTGYYPHTTGIYKNGDRWTRSWVENLAASGYYCVNVGKMHTAPYDTPLGFHERYEVENKDRYLAPVPAGEPPLPGEKYYLDEWDRALIDRGHPKPGREHYRQWEDYEKRLGAFEWPLPAESHPDVFVADRAADWIHRQPKTEQPLFMSIGFPGPHPPYDPTERWAETYLERELPPPVVSNADLSGQPQPLKVLREHNTKVDHDSVVHQIDPPPEHRHRQRAYYYANISMIDEGVGKIMDAIDANGYEDTVIVFTSDHGEAMGDHGHSQKWTMYDCITRVPTIVWAPQRFDGGRQHDELCQLFDIGPTILDFADAEKPESMEAQSLLPALTNEEWAGREYVFAEHARDGILRGTQFMTMIRSDDWKLVHFVDHEEGQLFDLESDPDEMDNLWDDPGHQTVKQKLLDELLHWRIESGHETAAWGADAR